MAKGDEQMVARRLLTALIIGIVAAGWVRGWIEMREAHEHARSILYPGSPEEMEEVLGQLRRYTDPESQALTRQLEERLQNRGRRRWWRRAR